MLFIAHRINTINELKQVPLYYGVEIDLRDYNDELILQHDPYIKEPITKFEDWLKHYSHSLIILNIKSEGIEYKVLESIKKYNITEYFFLDSSIPMINKLINKGENNIAIRYSELEPIEFVNNFRGKCKWLWIDCFTDFPEINSDITKGYKTCLVSPSLQGRSSEGLISRFNISEIKCIDAICEKNYNIKEMKPKIAIYCCGYLRGFRTSLIKLKELLLDRYDCDLYFYGIYNEYETDKYINEKYNIDAFIKQCNPKFYILENNKYEEDPIQRIKQMWFKIYMCNKFRLEVEERDNINYDLIIRIRPDLKLECSKEEIDKYINIAYFKYKIIIPSTPTCSYPELTLNTKNVEGNCNDQFAIGPSISMNTYCNLYKKLTDYNELGIINSSSCLYYHLDNFYLNFTLVDCPSTLLLKENIVITISGDSGTGKTTLANKFKEYLETKNNKVLLYECDRYHKWQRGDENWKSFTHLNPEANRIDQMKNDIIQLKTNNAINQVEYDHHNGKFTNPQYIEPLPVVIVLGLHTLLDSTLNKISDCKIYIDPDDELKKVWKIERDTKERGYTEEQIIKSINDRKEDYENYIKPQKEHADIIINYTVSENIRLNIKNKDTFIFDTIDKCFHVIVSHLKVL
jgi:uridine kinase